MPAVGGDGRVDLFRQKLLDGFRLRGLHAGLVRGVLGRACHVRETHLFHLREVPAHRIFDTHLHRKQRRREPRAPELQGKHSILEPREGHRAPFVGQGGADAGVEEFHEFGGDYAVRVLGPRRGIAGLLAHGRPARVEMFHDGAEDRRLQDMPVLVVPLADGDGVRLQGHPGDAVYGKQTPGQGRAPGRLGVGEFRLPRGQDRFAGHEPQGVRVRQGVGLNEHRRLSSYRTGPKSPIIWDT